MRRYYRPIPRWGEPRPKDGFWLAGGWCWFTQVEVGTRDGTTSMVPARELPADVRTKLAGPRGDVTGLRMDRPNIMGILNATPDSFSDGGQYVETETAKDHGLAMQRDGADIIDIGGESTRPGAKIVPGHTETARTSPVITAIRDQSHIPISIDTRKASVAKTAVQAGATLINDVSGFTYDPDMAQVAAESGAAVCLMHAQGTPQNMQDDPHYDHVLYDVFDFLEQRIDDAVAAGVDRGRIVIDPGIGFGKTLAHNLTLLRGMAVFHGLGCPILLGASRKRFIGTIGGGETAADRVSGSVAVALHGARQGVQILRVHDTFETKQALDLEWAINGRQ